MQSFGGIVASLMLQMHLLQVVVGLIPYYLKGCVFLGGPWLVPALLNDLHLGMVDRLAEVRRRRETLIGTTVAPRAPTTALPSQWSLWTWLVS